MYGVLVRLLFIMNLYIKWNKRSGIRGHCWWSLVGSEKEILVQGTTSVHYNIINIISRLDSVPPRIRAYGIAPRVPVRGYVGRVTLFCEVVSSLVPNATWTTVVGRSIQVTPVDVTRYL